MRKLEDIDPFELLHSTPDQLAKQLGISRTKKVGNINQEIENIRTKSQMERRAASRLSDNDLETAKREKAVHTQVFADVNKQINYMKTDHVRGKIFARRENEGTLIDSDSDSDNSVKFSPKERRKSILKKPSQKSYDDDDDITPYDSVSNVGRLRDRKHDFDSEDSDNEPTGGDIADDIVKQTMSKYKKDRKQFNKEVGMYESPDEDEKLLKKARKIGGKTLEERKAEGLSSKYYQNEKFFEILMIGKNFLRNNS